MLIKQWIINRIYLKIKICSSIIISLAVVSILPISSFANGAIQLPKTGQTLSYASGDDGAIQAGMAWPSPRFTDNGDQTVRDNLTGLIWSKNIGYIGLSACQTGNIISWKGAFAVVACFNANNYLGHNDWRLPNVNELESLVDISKYYSLASDKLFSGPIGCWSSTSIDAGGAWGVSYQGQVLGSPKNDDYGVLPVRSEGASCNSIICLPKTGQTTSYITGDDGDLQKGIDWPSPRFVDNTDGTVLDNLTGLMWTKNAKTPGPSACSPGGSMTWQGALDYVVCLNTNDYLGHNDWRLPNRRELLSLIDRSKSVPPLVIGHPFTDVQSSGGIYWSSSSSLAFISAVWNIDMYYGNSNYTKNDIGGIVWPVRGGYIGPLDILTLSVSKTGAGSGTVTANSGTITWSGSTGAASYSSGASVTLTATADSGSTFSSWGGDCTGTGTCSLTMEANKNVTANFASSTSTTTTTTGTCSVTITSSAKSFNNKGASGSVRITGSDTGCTWTATSNNDWIIIKSGASGSGKRGTVAYSVTANSGSASRTGTITINDKTFSVMQSGVPCSYAISPTSSNPAISANGGNGSLTVTPTPSDCSWTAVVDSKAKSWVTITDGSSGNGSGTVGYTIAAKTTKPARTGKINIVGSDSKVKKTFTVKQAK